jgi:AraC-like DNA-binding protein
MVVKTELQKLGFNPNYVELGEADLPNDLSFKDKTKINEVLSPLGFALIDDKKSRIIEQIKTLIIDLIQNKSNNLNSNLSDYLSQKLNHEYHYISNLFSEVEGTTIEKFLMAQKIEKVKELLIYDEFSLSEIAFQLNYSSVAHLSSQFKKVTGLTPSYFKNVKNQKRKSLDEL